MNPNYYDLKCPFCNEINDFTIVQSTFSGIEGESYETAKISYEAKDIFLLKCVKCRSIISIIPKGEVVTTKK